MRQDKDVFTRELPMPGAKGRPGRPPKPDALTPAERSRRYRARQREEAKQDDANDVPPPEHLAKSWLELRRSMICYRNAMWKMEGTILAMDNEIKRLRALLEAAGISV